MKISARKFKWSVKLLNSEFRKSSSTTIGFVAAISLAIAAQLSLFAALGELWPTALAFPLTHTEQRSFLPIKMSHTAAASKDSLRYQFYEATQTWVNCKEGPKPRKMLSILKYLKKSLSMISVFLDWVSIRS